MAELIVSGNQNIRTLQSLCTIYVHRLCILLVYALHNNVYPVGKQAG